MFDIYDLLIFSVTLGLVLWWWHLSGQKQRVLTFTQNYCTERGYQFLDQSLGFSSYRFIRDGLKRTFLCRVYSFDFSTDRQDRCNGEVAINGRTIIRVLLEADQIEISDFPGTPATARQRQRPELLTHNHHDETRH